MERPMWSCPERVVAACHAFEAMVRDLGPIQVEPLKSRIGFKARATFAGATFTKSTRRAGFVLPAIMHDQRLKVESFGGRHVHTLEVTDAVQLDDPDVRGWLADAYWLDSEGAGKRIS